jgi:hypothetical protein
MGAGLQGQNEQGNRKVPFWGRTLHFEACGLRRQPQGDGLTASHYARRRAALLKDALDPRCISAQFHRSSQAAISEAASAHGSAATALIGGPRHCTTGSGRSRTRAPRNNRPCRAKCPPAGVFEPCPDSGCSQVGKVANVRAGMTALSNVFAAPDVSVSASITL